MPMSGDYKNYKKIVLLIQMQSFMANVLKGIVKYCVIPNILHFVWESKIQTKVFLTLKPCLMDEYLIWFKTQYIQWDLLSGWCVKSCGFCFKIHFLFWAAWSILCHQSTFSLWKPTLEYFQSSKSTFKSHKH